MSRLVSSATINFQGWLNEGEHAWDNRKEEFGNMLQALGANIIGAQEVHERNLALIEFVLPHHQVILSNPTTKEGLQFTPLIVDKNMFEVVDEHSEWIGFDPTVQAPAHGANDIRAFTGARLGHRETGTQLIAVSAHFDHESEEARVLSAHQIINWVDQVDPSGTIPVIIPGDFNCSWYRHNPRTKYGRGGWDPFAWAEYQDAYLWVTKEIPPSNTMHLYRGEGFKATDDRHGWWDPDRIWIRGMNLYTARIEREFPLASDHYPVVATSFIRAS